MNKTRKLIEELWKENPEASNAELARLAQDAGCTVNERSLRRQAASVKAGTSSVKKIVDSSKSSIAATNLKSETENADGSKELSYRGTTSIQSMEEAIDFFDIDTDVWEVTSWTANSWDAGDKTNYQVKLKLGRISSEYSIDAVKTLKKEYKQAVTKVKSRKVKGSGVGIAVLSDFHIGAKVQDMVQTDDFSYEVVADRLQQAADQINRQGYKTVEVALLGDFIETITGLNHMN